MELMRTVKIHQNRLRRLVIKFFFIVLLLMLYATSTQTPVHAALWFVKTYPDYFHSHFKVWRDNKTLLDQVIVWFLSEKLTHDWIAREFYFLGNIKDKPVEQQAFDIQNQLKDMVIRFNGKFETPLWTFQRLVFGSSLCDGFNHLHALLLNELYPGVELFALWDPVTRESPHTLLKIRNKFGAVYIDFFMDPLTMTEIKLQQRPSDQKPFPASFHQNGFIIKKLASLPVGIGVLGPFKQTLSPKAMLPPSHDPWLAYLRGRIFHLYRMKEPAVEHYRQVVASHCQETFCQTAKIFLAALTGVNTSVSPWSGTRNLNL
ncbi:MAG: hypothetical protein HQL63_15965 [Magnetococcales bacterium]|nr:hypothetical protein [Magnetococcales bacterium]MBF0323005.1 hypothetical protein [Magnetococcales bacterium]